MWQLAYAFQMIENNSLPIEQLRKLPLNEEKWICCLVPVEQFTAVLTPLLHIKHMPGLHFFGKRRDEGPYEIAICESHLAWFRSRGVRFEIADEEYLVRDLSQPTDGHVRVHGARWKTTKAKNHFLGDAMQAIYAGSGHGFDQYLLNQVRDPVSELHCSGPW